MKSFCLYLVACAAIIVTGLVARRVLHTSAESGPWTVAALILVQVGFITAIAVKKR